VSMTWSTSTTAPIAACPLRSCTGLNTSQTAPVAATPGTRQPSRGTAPTLKRPDEQWVGSPPLSCLRAGRSMVPGTSKAGRAANRRLDDAPFSRRLRFDSLRGGRPDSPALERMRGPARKVTGRHRANRR
jgi:hypothetical protein